MSVATESTYDLNDLRRWPSCVPDWPSDGVALAVIGHPIAHSLSPVMHNAALAELAKTKPQFSKWRYFKFDIAPEELKSALDLFHKNRFRGLNLTVPHKALVVPHLDSKNAFVEDSGAANTLVYTERSWRGYNTDGIGLSAALNEDLGVELTRSDIILLGAGGAGRAAATQCILEHCASLWIGNRTQKLREELVTRLKKIPSQEAALIKPFSLKTLPEKLPANSIVINATSLGLNIEDGSPLDLTKISRPSKVYDMIYRPAQTALLRQASELGIPNSNGLAMLVHQGAASLELWSGEKPAVSVMHRAVRVALN